MYCHFHSKLRQRTQAKDPSGDTTSSNETQNSVIDANVEIQDFVETTLRGNTYNLSKLLPHLLLLLLGDGAHIFLKRAVGDLKTGQSPKTNTKDSEKNNRGDKAHEDTRGEELVLLEQRELIPIGIIVILAAHGGPLSAPLGGHLYGLIKFGLIDGFALSGIEDDGVAFSSGDGIEAIVKNSICKMVN